MRRRRLPSRRASSVPAPLEISSDYRYLEQVVSTQHPVREARVYLQRHMANRVDVRLVEARRGEQVGVVRAIEVHHENGGERTWIRGERVLANGAPASFYVPDHLVRTRVRIDGVGARTGALGAGDRIVLHVPVRGFFRYLPAIYQGEGPVENREVVRRRDTALARWGGGLPEEAHRVLEIDEDPARRLLFLFQHLMMSVTDTIEHRVGITDPLVCDPGFLPWLASWVGFELDESLPVHQQRELVRRAIRLYRTRGTKAGIEDMVRVLTSAPVRVQERTKPSPMVLGRGHLAGGGDIVERYDRAEPPGCFLLDPGSRSSTGFFVLVLEPRERFRDRFGERAASVLRRIVQVVSQERPTHVRFTIQFDIRRT